MANYQRDDQRRRSAIQTLLNMFYLSNTATVPVNGDDDVSGDVDEPPEEPPSPMHVDPPAVQQQKKQKDYTKSAPPPLHRKESLLTRALTTDPNAEPTFPLPFSVPTAMSRASTFSNASMHSPELTSDADDTSPARSASPSPPLPATQYHRLHTPKEARLPPSRVSFAISTGQEKPAEGDSQESKIEANLGRKRCITFACGSKPAVKDPHPTKVEAADPAQPSRRKCLLTFADPARPAQTSDQTAKSDNVGRGSRSPSCIGTSAPTTEQQTVGNENDPKLDKRPISAFSTPKNVVTDPTSTSQSNDRALELAPFHEFATSNDHDDAWIHEPIDSQHKLTLSDCMKKEIAIRKLGEEAEEEAEQEEKDNDEMDDENEDGDHEDDFAPSDDGNESDNEAGFAESDEDSSDASDDQFWVPANTTAATSLEKVSPVRPLGTRRQSGSSADSLDDSEFQRKQTSESIAIKFSKHRRSSKRHQLRPGTPELPDSTDFVCGTFDEDRPLEAAYISCLEQKKREKHIPIPQDIDPSFPTSDPEDIDEEDDENVEVQEDHLWLKDQLEGFEEDPNRGHGSKHPRKRLSLRSPHRTHSPPPKRGAHRSPPPPRQNSRRSPPPPSGRSLGQSPKRLDSLPSSTKLRSSPETRTQSSAQTSPKMHQPHHIGISRLGQRRHMRGTSSLPRTPNPFFHNYQARYQQSNRISLEDGTPGRELHVRGPVDIVIGLEKKRQKRKEKFWRQHCRKAAKEQAERKTIPGKGAERMRELGLECAERTRGYGLGQQPALVISL